VEVHANPARSESYPLDFETKALFPTVLTRQGNPAARGHNSVPWQSLGPLQRADGEPRGPREASGGGYLPVRDHLSAWHDGNHPS